ncbi:MAG: acetyl-CoA carboxylase biotin carboxyl carrier protein [Ahrensia sp.]
MADKKNSIDSGLVQDLANILNDTSLTEIEVEQGDLRIRVSREPAPQMFSHSAPASAAFAPAPAAPGAAANSPAEPATAGPQAGEFTAPMVGTVYYAPAPGEPPFSKVGDKVKEGQTMLIIEAMKVMNQIPAPRAGTITKFLVEDGDPVEYGQPMLVIE